MHIVLTPEVATRPKKNKYVHITDAREVLNGGPRPLALFEAVGCSG